jgi:hypothetical protein
MPALVSLQKSSLRSWFWLLLLLNLIFLLVSRSYLAPLNSGELVQFETAKRVSKAQAIIADWSATGKYEKAMESIWIDFLFILFYVAGLMVAVLFLSEATHHPLLLRSGRFFRWLIPAAGICDVLENIFMQQSLQSHPTKLTVMLSYDMAVSKFSILIVTFLFLVLCFLYWVLRKLFPAVV